MAKVKRTTDACTPVDLAIPVREASLALRNASRVSDHDLQLEWPETDLCRLLLELLNRELQVFLVDRLDVVRHPTEPTEYSVRLVDALVAPHALALMLVFVIVLKRSLLLRSRRLALLASPGMRNDIAVVVARDDVDQEVKLVRLGNRLRDVGSAECAPLVRERDEVRPRRELLDEDCEAASGPVSDARGSTRAPGSALWHAFSNRTVTSDEII